jgi:catechol 2,3-dioxygenase-like lactoylglutathione lyase family enzyme
MIEISGLHHLRISVTNLVRYKEFYSEVIGFEVAADSPGSPEEPAVRTALRGAVFLANGMLFGLASLSSGSAVMSASLTAVVCIRPMPRVAGRE